MKKYDIVVGLGFGDEGKGNVVNHLSTDKSLVVRFNSGHQAGHTAIYNNKRHVFSSIGAGSLKGASTYLSEYVTVYPIAIIKEIEQLGFTPTIYVNSECKIVTPYDVIYNSLKVDNLVHGTVGVGFGTTLEREKNHYHLRIKDLFYPTIYKEKINLIHQYYSKFINYDNIDINLTSLINEFFESIEKLKNIITVVDSLSELSYEHKHIIFEGAQGTLLDSKCGFFPNVTRSRTTVKNAIKLIKSIDDLIYEQIIVHYITRSYLTRHGNGFFPNVIESSKFNTYFNENKDETNVYNKFQGEFKKTFLNFDLLKYAIECNRKYLNDILINEEILTITCLDQLNLNNDILPIIYDGGLIDLTIPALIKNLDILDYQPIYSSQF